MTWWLPEASLPFHISYLFREHFSKQGKGWLGGNLGPFNPHYTEHCFGEEEPLFLGLELYFPLLEGTSETLADLNTEPRRRAEKLLRYLTQCPHQSALSYHLYPSANRKKRAIEPAGNLSKKPQYLGSPEFPQVGVIVFQRRALERVSGERHGKRRSETRVRGPGARAAPHDAGGGSRVPTVWNAQFRLPGNSPPSVTEANSLREGRHLAVRRGDTPREEAPGTQGESAGGEPGSPACALGGLSGKTSASAGQQSCNTPPSSKEAPKDDPGICYSVASNRRIFQSSERMRRKSPGVVLGKLQANANTPCLTSV